MRLRYAVIGAGVVAPLHLRAIAALEDAELIGISAIGAGSARARAEEAGCPLFGNHRELLVLEPDVVVVCTPHPSHPALTAEALEAGAHVLVEKPLAPEAREAEAMIEAAERAGRLLGVCFQQRFRPVIAAAQELIAGGRLGELVRVAVVDPLYRPNAYYTSADWRGTWQGEGGGVLMNQAPHTLDLLCHLAGPPATVWGRSRRRLQPIVAEEVVLAAGRGDHLDVHEDFAGAIRSGRAPHVPARDAIWSLELANAIVLSTHTGQAVPLPVDRDAYAALLADLRSGRAKTP